MECGNSEDFISALPDCIAHHILSFLDMKFAVRTCILSKRWMYIFKSLPFMRFYQNVYNGSIEDFIEFVGNVLDLHNGPGTSGLQTFTLRALNNTISIASPLKLPTFLYTSRTMITLRLEMGDKGPPILELPDLAYLPSLKNLYLRNLLIRNLGSFISSCPVLEALGIKACKLGEPNDSSISALNLKLMELHSLLSADGHANPCITVYAPKLEVFCWYGSNYLSTLYMPSLVTGVIGAFDHYDSRRSCVNPRKKPETKNVLNCLLSFANARHLAMTDLSVELAIERGSTLGSTITSFSNLTILKMAIYHSVYSVSTISSLLVKCPSLEKLDLVFRKLPNCRCFDETKAEFGDGENGNSEAKLQPKCMSSHLKVVDIRGSQWNVYELEFVKFLLKNATVLEKMCLSRKDKSRCFEYKNKIEVFPRASPYVHIVFD